MKKFLILIAASLLLFMEVSSALAKSYVLSDSVAISTGGCYALSGTLNYSGGGKPTAKIYFLAFNSAAMQDLQAAILSDSAGLEQLTQMSINESGAFPFEATLALNNSSADKAVLVLETDADSAELIFFENVKLSPIEDVVSADSMSTESVNGESEGAGAASGGAANNASSLLSGSSSSAFDSSSISGDVIKVSSMSFLTSGITVFLNSVSGADTNDGDAPENAKQTIAAALSVEGVSEVILAGGTTPYIAPLIKPAAGTSVTLRPNGSVIIKGQ